MPTVCSLSLVYMCLTHLKNLVLPPTDSTLTFDEFIINLRDYDKMLLCGVSCKTGGGGVGGRARHKSLRNTSLPKSSIFKSTRTVYFVRKTEVVGRGVLGVGGRCGGACPTPLKSATALRGETLMHWSMVSDNDIPLFFLTLEIYQHYIWKERKNTKIINKLDVGVMDNYTKYYGKFHAVLLIIITITKLSNLIGYQLP